jgi:ArsR family transcriptional regulator
MPTTLQALKSDFFRALAHPTRISLLERLVQGERSVQELQAALALEQPIVSQHLAALRAKNVVTVRREGTQAYYALRSPLVADLLRVAREFLNQQLSESQTESQSMLRELKREVRRG